jgi:acyl carrier protein
VEPEALRRWLAERVPAYLVPAAVTVLPEMPHTPSGKLDREALPVPRPVPGQQTGGPVGTGGTGRAAAERTPEPEQASEQVPEQAMEQASEQEHAPDPGEPEETRASGEAARAPLPEEQPAPGAPRRPEPAPEESQEWSPAASASESAPDSASESAPAPEPTPAPAPQPAASREDLVAEAFASVLRLPQVAPEDSFFDLGGDSIVSIQLVSQLRKAGLVLTPQDVFEHKTVRALAAVARETGRAQGGENASGVGELPLTPIVHWLRELDGPIDGFHQAVLLQVPGGVRQMCSPRPCRPSSTTMTPCDCGWTPRARTGVSSSARPARWPPPPAYAVSPSHSRTPISWTQSAGRRPVRSPNWTCGQGRWCGSCGSTRARTPRAG